MRRVLLVNDMSGYGKCSALLQIPVIAACGDIPSLAMTTYLSNHTGYEYVHKVDMKSSLKETFDIWNKNDFKFDASIVGYISDPDSILNIKEYIGNQKLENDKMLNLIDPVLGDNGKMYDGFGLQHLDNIKKLITIADIVTPNLTEACLLTGVNYEEIRLKLGILEYDGRIDDKDPDSKKQTSEKLKEVSNKVIQHLKPILDKIIFKRMQITIITGIELYNCVVTMLDVYNGDEKKRQTTCNFMPKLDNRYGTGDLFDVMFMEMLLKGYNLIDSLKITTGFIQESLKFTINNKLPKNDGLYIEPILVPNLEYIRTHTKNKNDVVEQKTARM